jgi:hypothetical protein
MGTHHAQTASSAHCTFAEKLHLETVFENLHALAFEGCERGWLDEMQNGFQRRGRVVKIGIDGAGGESLGERFQMGGARRERRDVEFVAGGIEIARACVGKCAGRNPSRRDRISGVELHSRKLSAGFGCHQMTVARICMTADQAGPEGAAAGCKDHGSGANLPMTAIEPRIAGRACDRAVPVQEKLDRGVMIENADAAL